MLFSGVDDSGEGGLEERMQALGGEWNAFTSNADTTFVIEAPASNQRKVLDLLLALLTRTRIKGLPPRSIYELTPAGHALAPIVDSMRALFAAEPVGSDIWVAMAWLVGILVVAYSFAVVIYRRTVS